MSTKQITPTLAELASLDRTIKFYAVPTTPAGAAAHEAAVARREALLDAVEAN
jgi:hypothetical protein